MRVRLTPLVLRGIVRTVALAVPAIAACGGAVSSVENNADPNANGASSGGQTNSSGGGGSRGSGGGGGEDFGSTSSGSSSGAIEKDASDAPYDAGYDACNTPCGCYVGESKTTTIDVATWCAGPGSGSDYCKDPSAGSCYAVCPQQEWGTSTPLWMTSCSNDTDGNGKATVKCEYHSPPCGRRPAGFEAVAVGGWFARCAELEDASIEAFHVLDEELAALGAPRALRRRARRAAVDEVRHTESMTTLARRAGHDVARRTPSGSASKRAMRSAFDIAIENAVEGCVREAYGALLAMWQAESARDERVALAMKDIAHDEARHAALAWDVHRWLGRRLDDEERRRVDAAMSDALDTLAREVLDTPADDRLGLPDARAATALVGELRAAVMAA